jgi:Glycosyltransferase like family
MIAFGCSITSGDLYERYAERGIRLAAEASSELLPFASATSIFRTYNLILDRAAELDDLEALVLLHQDAEIIDRDFCEKVRRALADPTVAIVGCAGAVGVRSIAWWEGSVTWASFTHRYEELGGGEIPALAWKADEIPSYATTGEVDAIDGFVMALSPWAVKELRFDESLGQALHGYDLDFCLQARAAGHKVVTEDFRVIHHHSLELIGDLASWIEAHMKVAEKWDGRLPDVGTGPGDWKQRARRAEAEASAARTLAAAADLLREAGISQLERRVAEHERDLEKRYQRLAGQQREALREYSASRSWRITSPFRALGRLIRRRRGAPTGEAAD